MLVIDAGDKLQVIHKHFRSWSNVYFHYPHPLSLSITPTFFFSHYTLKTQKRTQDVMHFLCELNMCLCPCKNSRFLLRRSTTLVWVSLWVRQIDISRGRQRELQQKAENKTDLKIGWLNRPQFGFDGTVNATEERNKRFLVSIMDILPALASTMLASTVSILRKNAAIQIFTKKLNRR